MERVKQECVDIWNSRLFSNKGFRMEFYSLILIGILDGVVNAPIDRGGFPIVLIYGILIVPLLGIIGIIYEKVKYGESILISICASAIGLFLTPWIYAIGLYSSGLSIKLIIFIFGIFR